VDLQAPGTPARPLGGVNERTQILISGYYGFGNFGDEAILRIMIDELRSRVSGASITVLSANPVQTASTFGVAAIPRMNAHVVTDAIRTSDLVISGGGGLLQNATSLRSLLYYTGIVREAKRANRKCAIFAQGIGPLDFFGRQVVKGTCGDVGLAIVRDAQSAALLQPLLPRVRVEVGADPVFLAPVSAPTAARDALAREGITGTSGDIITIVVRKSPLLPRIAPQLAAGIDRIVQRQGVHAVFVPLQRPDDVEASIEVIRRCKSAPTLLGGPFDLPAMTALLQRSSAVISMRLHALILAARLRVPLLAIPYDPKVSSLLEELTYPLPPFDRSSSGTSLFDRLWDERASLAAALAGATQPLARRASYAFDRLAEFAGGSTA
jgi:polysaccharide pyruvyl transferase CsaB